MKIAHVTMRTASGCKEYMNMERKRLAQASNDYDIVANPMNLYYMVTPDFELRRCTHTHQRGD